VAPGANIYGVKVLDDKGSGTYVSVLAGLDEILHIREKAPEKAMVVSMSLAGPCDLNICDKDPLILAMEELSKSRVTTIVAAGNSYRDACTITPAASPYVLTIGASTINDNNAPFSNWGTCVDLFAPGDSIVSACSSASSELFHKEWY
jgi:subtilisin family serine protease